MQYYDVWVEDLGKQYGDKRYQVCSCLPEASYGTIAYGKTIKDAKINAMAIAGSWVRDLECPQNFCETIKNAKLVKYDRMNKRTKNLYTALKEVFHSILTGKSLKSIEQFLKEHRKG